MKQIKRPNVLELVPDPDLQLSLQQVQDLTHLCHEDRRRIIGQVLAPKLALRLELERLNHEPLFERKGQDILNLLSDYLLTIHLLPVFGERTSIRDFVTQFEKQARRLQKLMDKENYCNLVSGLAPATEFSVAVTQVYVLRQALDSAIDSAITSIQILNSNQLSVSENARQHLAWVLANLLEADGIDLHTDSNSFFVRILRACVGAVHARLDADAPEVLRLARNVVRKKS